MYTTNGSAVAIWPVNYFLSSCGSKDRCGEFRSSVSQYFSRSRSFPRSFAASLTVVYSAGTVVMPKGNRSHRKSISSTIDMHVDTVFTFACIRQ